MNSVKVFSLSAEGGVIFFLMELREFAEVGEVEFFESIEFSLESM